MWLSQLWSWTVEKGPWNTWRAGGGGVRVWILTEVAGGLELRPQLHSHWTSQVGGRGGEEGGGGDGEGT